ncbi:hypothetical protein [Yersinia pseudotuberculosis]|uniref:hypothetical protein n=1 Tax=Yersinia pseudotuberculosis TaxID=633 RepID=UPI000F6E1BD3|nr:hypothetical protein [Yersinia pseudotuberculosis]VEE71650.1 Uncharacterised protein [Yersinia pseudotuberculosis]
MKELNSFTVEEIEEIIRSCQQEIHNTPTSDEFPVSPRLLLSLARIALAAKRAEPVYQYQSGVCTFDDIEWVWDDCDKGFYEQYDPTRRRIVYTTPQLNSPEIPDGWKLVPIEPTRQMMSQGHFAMGGTDRGKFMRIYQAMLAAAPEKPL